MDDRTKAKKTELVNGLLAYFNNDISKVKRFANQLRTIGINIDDYDTLCAIEKHSEGIIVLLGMSNFGVLSTVCKAKLFIEGAIPEEAYIKQHAERLDIPAPKGE